MTGKIGVQDGMFFEEISRVGYALEGSVVGHDTGSFLVLFIE